MNKKIFGVIFLAAFFASSVFAENEKKSDITPYPTLPYNELIFPPNPTFSVHAPSIVELSDGGLFAVWYNVIPPGTTTAIWGSRKPAGADKWTKPSIVNYSPGHSNKNPVLYMNRDKKLLLFWAEETRWRKWKRDRLRMKVSGDLGRTWGKSRNVEISSGFLSRTHPIKLNDGRLILPIYTDWSTSSAVITSWDDGLTWSKPRFMLFFIGTQPAVIQRSDSSLFALMRTGMPPRRCWQAESTNLGRNWKNQRLSAIDNPGSSIDMIRLRNGHVVLVFNNSKSERSHLSIALSYDEGRTWAHIKEIEVRPGNTNIYPSLMQDSNGLIHAVYSFDGRQSICHFVTDEKWIESQNAQPLRLN